MRCALFPSSKKRETYLLFIMLLLRLLQFSCQAGCQPLKSKRKEQTSSLTELDDIDKNIASDTSVLSLYLTTGDLKNAFILTTNNPNNKDILKKSLR